MRAEIVSISNGTLAGNKITMFRGDTLEVTLRVLLDDDTPIPVTKFQDRSFKLTALFAVELKDGGELLIKKLESNMPREIIFGVDDQLTLILTGTEKLPAPLNLLFNLTIVQSDGGRVSTIYTGNVIVEKTLSREGSDLI